MSLFERYRKEILEQLKKDLGLENNFEVPSLEKIVINCGLGSAADDQKVLDEVSSKIAKITGQRPIITKARAAIASFNIREGQKIGIRVTLRGKKMYDFFEKFVSVVLPRLRDFRGVPQNSFDKRGNYSVGLKEIDVFPEVEVVKGNKETGLEVTFVTTAKDDEKAKKLLEALGMPFQKQK